MCQFTSVLTLVPHKVCMTQTGDTRLYSSLSLMPCPGCAGASSSSPIGPQLGVFDLLKPGVMRRSTASLNKCASLYLALASLTRAGDHVVPRIASSYLHPLPPFFRLSEVLANVSRWWSTAAVVEHGAWIAGSFNFVIIPGCGQSRGAAFFCRFNTLRTRFQGKLNVRFNTLRTRFQGKLNVRFNTLRTRFQGKLNVRFNTLRTRFQEGS
ncbi:hypothetical protein RRG08_003893 [Elysia crispata]|uniref:Uncharacterized protein n=1 Tax=Elysia crispata TaxID=231223 RepID=A0AAE0ZE21_9GAST|nr:hypothetical protein RRG08_003893 [Elysia crispata]